MPQPLIGITCSTSALDPTAQNPQERLNTAYARAVWLGGGIPVLLPNLPPGEAGCAALGRLDGVLITGGVDVSPERYGQTAVNDTLEVDPRRDAAEFPVIAEALRRDLPILCICRGIQSLNVHLGGTLWQDLPSQRPTDIVHRQTEARSVATHTVRVEPGSLLAATAGSTEFGVNTFHHQSLDRLGRGLKVTASAPDGIIEAVELPGASFLLAVQWHPEEMVDNSPECARLFRALAAASGAQRSSRRTTPPA
jgi:putative glutamine amidotransferase